MSPCPFPGCAKPAPGRHGVFCADHHFQIEPGYTRLLLRTKIAMSRAHNESDRAHLEDQLTGYINSALRITLKGGSHAA